MRKKTDQNHSRSRSQTRADSTTSRRGGFMCWGTAAGLVHGADAD